MNLFFYLFVLFFFLSLLNGINMCVFVVVFNNLQIMNSMVVKSPNKCINLFYVSFFLFLLLLLFYLIIELIIYNVMILCEYNLAFY